MSKDPFSLDRWYMLDDTIIDSDHNYKVYDNGHFICTGLTFSQAVDFCRGASLLDFGIIELML